MTDKLIYFLSASHCQSAIAEAWAEKLELTHWKVKSSAWKEPRRNPMSVKAMKEFNIDLAKKPRLLVNASMLDRASYIIAIYDFKREKEFPLSNKYKDKLMRWNINDPESSSSTREEMWAGFQEMCDHIAENVKDLEEKIANT